MAYAEFSQNPNRGQQPVSRLQAFLDQLRARQVAAMDAYATEHDGAHNHFLAQAHTDYRQYMLEVIRTGNTRVDVTKLDNPSNNREIRLQELEKLGIAHEYTSTSQVGHTQYIRYGEEDICLKPINDELGSDTVERRVRDNFPQLHLDLQEALEIAQEYIAQRSAGAAAVIPTVTA